jgi:hypothetical protein
MSRVEAKMNAIRCAKKALKKYSRRSNAAKKVVAQIWNVVLAEGCEVVLMDLVEQLHKRYAKKGGQL